MAASTYFVEHNGTAGGLPARGASATTGITSVNWGSRDVANLDFTTSVVTGGQRSFDKAIFLVFSGSWNSIGGCKVNAVSGLFGQGIELYTVVSGSGFYTTPSQNITNPNLTRILTQTGLTTTGLVCPLLSTGGFNNDYTLTAQSGSLYNNSSYAGAICTTPYFISQIVTDNSANPGNSTTRVFSFVWDES